MRRPVVQASGGYGGRNRRGAAALNRAARPLIESLEDRRLLSVVVANGVLDIIGTPGPDNITVQYTAASTATIRIKGQGFRQSVPAAGINKIIINGDGGGDSITLSDAHGVLAIPAKVHGGPGSETVIGSSAGDDTLVGGNGHDLIQANGAGNIVRGGSGPADTLVGGSADTIVDGPGENLVSTNDGASFTVASSKAPTAINLSASVAATQAQLFSDGVVNPTIEGYTPDQLRVGYGMGLLGQATTTNLGQGQTIAIVDPFDSPTVLNDLTTFSQTFDLPLPTAENFEKVYAGGQQPAADSDSDAEIDLDVEWAHALAPDARIILVEANSLSLGDLFNAIVVAGNLVANSPAGGGVVSMSFGTQEPTGTADPTLASAQYSMDQVFEDFPTVSFVAASGDTAGEQAYPSMSPYVTSVGGTTMNLNADGTITAATTAWADSGGGISLNEPEPNYQTQALGANADLPNGLGARLGPDVAMLANPDTGVAEYDSTPNPGGDSGWQEAGGTSLASPLFAAVVALANQSRIAQGLPVIGSNLNDAIYFFNTYFPGRDFALGNTTGFNEQTGWGQPLVPNFVADLGNLSLNGQTPPPYSLNVNTTGISSDTTLYGDLDTGVTGVTNQLTDVYKGRDDGTANSTGPTTFTLILNQMDNNQNSISYTVTCTINDLTTGAFTGFLAGTDGGLFTLPTLPTGETGGIFFEGTVTPLSNQTSEISGDFYGAIENPDGSFTQIGTHGVGGSGDGTVEGEFST